MESATTIFEEHYYFTGEYDVDKNEVIHLTKAGLKAMISSRLEPPKEKSVSLFLTNDDIEWLQNRGFGITINQLAGQRGYMPWNEKLLE